MTRAPIRVVIADDSRTMRAMLRAAFDEAGGIAIVGEAADGLEAVKLAAKLRPDVVTMDVSMPELDGLQATAAIMAESPVRILMVCALDQSHSVALSMRAMAAGALEVIAKPSAKPPAPAPASAASFAVPPSSSSLRSSSSAAVFCSKVVEAVRLMADVPVVTRRRPSFSLAPVPRHRTPIEAVGLVASTGGPPALAQVLGGLPPDLRAFVLVAQHMAPGFVAGLVRWFAEETSLQVVVAVDGAEAAAGHVYLPPDGHDVVMRAPGVLGVEKTTASICPNGDVLLASLARHHGARAAGVVLTGMGEDGAAGLLALRHAGGITIAQDEASSVVHGMPRAAAEAGAASHVLPLDAIAGFLAHALADSHEDALVVTSNHQGKTR